jgi:hypothetical protein
MLSVFSSLENRVVFLSQPRTKSAPRNQSNAFATVFELLIFIDDFLQPIEIFTVDGKLMRQLSREELAVLAERRTPEYEVTTR